MIKLKINKDSGLYPFLDMDSITKEFEIVNDSNQADYILCKNNVPEDYPKNKVILIMTEAPMSGGRRELYKAFNQFQTVICFDPNKVAKNQFPFRASHIFYPHCPFLEEYQERKDTTITDRRIFYAGRRSKQFENLPNDLKTVPICDVRKQMVDELYLHPKIAAIIGVNWNGKAKEVRSTDIFKGKTIPWKTKRHAKIYDINEFNADFVMCMENCMQKGYISEKIHDGFNSDRVVLYLGDPEVEKYIPLNCFIDLRPYFNKKTKEFDMKKVIELTQNITQEEYDTIINNAREWRETIPKDNWEKAKNKLTDFLIKRLQK